MSSGLIADICAGYEGPVDVLVEGFLLIPERRRTSAEVLSTTVPFEDADDLLRRVCLAVVAVSVLAAYCC